MMATMFLVAVLVFGGAGGAGGASASPSCADDSSWYAKKMKQDCAWVAKKAKKLCKLKTKDADGVSALKACPNACQICDIACDADSSAWYSKKKKKVRRWRFRAFSRPVPRVGLRLGGEEGQEALQEHRRGHLGLEEDQNFRPRRGRVPRRVRRGVR
jgi:hypothetical protein